MLRLPKPLTPLAALSALAFALLLVAPGSVTAFGGAPADLWVDVAIGPWNARNIGPGNQYAVGWTIHGPITSCTATGDWSWVYPPSSFQNGVWTNIYGTALFSAPASGAKTFHLSCSGPGGSAQDTETIHVGNYNDINPEPWVNLALNQGDNLCPGCIGTGPGQQMRFQWGVNGYAGMDVKTCRAWGDITDFQGSGPILGPYGGGTDEFRTDPPTYPSPDPTRPEHYVVGITCDGPYGAVTNVQYLDAAQAPQSPPPTVDIKANGSDGPVTVSSGGSANLSWTSQNATACSASGAWAGSKTTSGTQGSGTIFSPSTFTINCTGPGGSVTDSVTLSVGAPAPAVNIKANGSDGPVSVTNGSSVTVSWTSVDATSCTVTPGNWTGTSGSQVSGPLGSAQTYRASCTGPGGSASDTVTVNVTAAPGPVADIKINGSDSPGTVPYGSTITVSWTSQNATACTVTPRGWTGTGGSRTDGPVFGTQSYQLNCTGPGGSASDSVQVGAGTRFPDIAASPSQLLFSAQPGEPAPAAQQITVRNTGYANLTWQASANQSWCHATGSGTIAQAGSASLSVTVDAPVSEGTRNCTVTITGQNAASSPQQVGVIYTVQTIPHPTIVLSPTQLTFGGVAGGATPPPQTVTVSNGGQATLNWTASSNVTWCYPNTTSGSVAPGASQQVNISVTAPTNPGNYDWCVITFSDPNATNNPQRLPVTYLVTPAPVYLPTIQLSPTSFSFSAVTGSPAPTGQALTVRNSGTGQLSAQLTTNFGWCHTSPEAVQVQPGSFMNVTVYVDAPSYVGTFNCQVTVADPRATNNPQRAQVTYVVTATAQGLLTVSPQTLTFTAPVGGPAPAPQPAQAHNAGTSALTWQASTDQGWCSVSPASGTLGAGLSTGLSVSVAALPTPGSRSCGVTVRDTTNSQTRGITVIYTVGTTSVGPPSNVVASSPSCGAVRLTWSPGSGANAYNVYRSLSSAPSGSSYAYAFGVTTYTDLAANSGTRYYYWVESAGTNVKVPADTNASGGVASSACNGLPPQVSSLTASVGCGSINLSWTNVSGETGYRLYRRLTDAAVPSPVDLLRQFGADVTSYADSVAPGSYYYWISSVNAVGEAAVTRAYNNPYVLGVCAGDLSPSDKNIRAINGAPQPNNDCDYDSFQGLPLGQPLRLGDVVTWELNLCNKSTTADATQVRASNLLTNLDEPPNGWNAKAGGRPLVYAGRDVQPSEGQYSYLSGQKTLLFNVGTVPKNDVVQITYDSAVKSDPGETSSCPKCENKAHVDYLRSTGDPASLDLHTGAIFYRLKP